MNPSNSPHHLGLSMPCSSTSIHPAGLILLGRRDSLQWSSCFIVMKALVINDAGWCNLVDPMFCEGVHVLVCCGSCARKQVLNEVKGVAE